MSQYYVYVWKLPGGEPFYVGKGKGKRAFSHLEPKSKNANLKRMFDLIKLSGNYPTCEIRFMQNEAEAFKAESELIYQFIDSGLLANKDIQVPVNWELFKTLLIKPDTNIELLRQRITQLKRML